MYGNIYTQLLEYIISTELVFYALMIGAVIVLRRRRPAADRPYRTIGYPVTPLIYISIALLLVVDLAYLAPATSGMGFLLVALGHSCLSRAPPWRGPAVANRRGRDATNAGR